MQRNCQIFMHNVYEYVYTIAFCIYAGYVCTVHGIHVPMFIFDISSVDWMELLNIMGKTNE